jgi:single-strand DNA-binding protein
MIGRNRITLIGFVGHNPEYCKKSPEKITFSMATIEQSIIQLGQPSNDTQWHAIVATGDIAQFIEKNLVKGSEILIEGALRYTAKKNGDGVFMLAEIHAKEVLIINK